MKKRIQVQGILMFVALILTIIFMLAMQKLIFVQWQKEGWDEVFDTAGVVLICLGYFIRMTARAYKSECRLQGRTLVTDGIYRYVRNPMYLGSFIIGVGIVSVLFQFWLVFVVALVFGFIYEPQTKKEEEFLQTTFGQEYLDYKIRTPKYFPRAVFAFLRSVFEQLPFYWQGIKNELSSFVVLVLIVTTLEAWQDPRLFGGKEFLEEFSEFFCFFIGVIFLVFVLNKIFVRNKRRDL